MTTTLYVLRTLDNTYGQIRQGQWEEEVTALLGHGCGYKLMMQPGRGIGDSYSVVEQRIAGVQKADGIVLSTKLLAQHNSYGWGGRALTVGQVTDDIITRYIELDIAHALMKPIGTVHTWTVKFQEARRKEMELLARQRKEDS